ncbi:MAG: hypothetical protein IJH62_03910, partial [Mogibacterium sp.]|nr:hypothetical protein [Mogibacterium sp.]
EYANKTFGGYTADVNGVIHLSMPSGESRTIEYLPVEMKKVKVEEKDIPEGFTPEGGAEKTVKLIRSGDARADYVNIYDPAEAVNNIQLKVRKTISGRDWTDGDAFTFVLEQLTGDSIWTKIAEKEADKGDKTPDFTAAIQSIHFTEAATYTFRVREDEESSGGIIVDPTISEFSVVVADDEHDGKLKIKKVVSTAPNTTITRDKTTKAPIVQMAFENKYDPQGSVDVDINITKNLVDTSGQSKAPSGFVFGLYDEDGELIADTVETGVSGEASIRRVYVPSDAGNTYVYTLKEIAGEEPGYTYDDKEYKLAVSVVDEEGTLKAYIYDYDPDRGDIPSGAGDTYDAAFENKYDPEDVSVTLEGDKDLTGRDMKTGEFKFDLYETDGTYNTEDLKPVQTVSNKDADGTFSFSLNYCKVGTYYYVIKENTSKPLGGVTYDTSEYHVKVIVTDEGGALAAETSILDSAGKEAEIAFKNSYSPEPASLSLTGTKTLEGKKLEDGMFRFGLFASDSSFSKEEALGEVTNTAGGAFAFNAASYTKEGKYYYIVKELSDKPVDGIIYDKTVFHVTVTVTDDKEGKLVTSSDISAVGDTEKSADRISFTNTYKGSEPVDPDKDKDKKDKSVKTGDSSKLIGWVIMLLLSAEGLMVLLLIGRRSAGRRI